MTRATRSDILVLAMTTTLTNHGPQVPADRPPVVVAVCPDRAAGISGPEMGAAMSKWTPEPWAMKDRSEDGKSYWGSNRFAVGADGAGLSDRAIRSAEELDANQARAVACVNGCKGINPEAVADLLAACEAALVDEGGGFALSYGTEMQLKDAIAKARGK